MGTQKATKITSQNGRETKKITEKQAKIGENREVVKRLTKPFFGSKFRHELEYEERSFRQQNFREREDVLRI